jgi:hypothetical protein
MVKGRVTLMEVPFVMAAHCNGGAKSMTDSAATATRDTVRKIAEALGNSERLRSTK